MKIYNYFAKLLRNIMRLHLRKWQVQDQRASSKPTVYLVHHQNFYGPYHAIAMLKEEVRLWSLHAFCSRKACFEQYYYTTFTKQMKMPSPLAYLFARMSACVVPSILNSFKVIPVYRHSEKTAETMESSIKSLLEGKSVLICPDRNYDDSSSEMKEIYHGFFHLELEYYKMTGIHLPFTPVYCSKKQEKVVISEPLYFQDKTEFKEEREEIEHEFISRMNFIGKQCGDIA